MALEFDKIDDTCSNLYLVDERLCLKNSYEIFNTNTKTLTANIGNLNVYGNEFNKLYSNFATNSARWILAISNFQTLSSDWFSAETTCKKLSSYWQQDKSIIYTKIVDILTYNTNSTPTKTAIATWLNTYFLEYYPEKQILNVDLYLSYKHIFSWEYVKTYFENCVPPKTSLAGNCNCGFPAYNCNKIWNWVTGQFLSSCNSLANFCRIEGQESSGQDNIKCPNVGNRNVNFNIQTTNEFNNGSNPLLSDKYTCKVITLKFQKQNNSFISI
jgi:hypothetical protein